MYGSGDRDGGGKSTVPSWSILGKVLLMCQVLLFRVALADTSGLEISSNHTNTSLGTTSTNTTSCSGNLADAPMEQIGNLIVQKLRQLLNEETVLIQLDPNYNVRLRYFSTNATYSLKVNRGNNETHCVEVPPQQRGLKVKKSHAKILTYMMVPALMLAGLMPWVLPPLKMMVMTVSMINNMALSSAFFTLVRNYVFNSKEEEHIVYVNKGYSHYKKPMVRPMPYVIKNPVHLPHR